MKGIIEEKFDPLVWWITWGLLGIFQTKRYLVVFCDKPRGFANCDQILQATSGIHMLLGQNTPKSKHSGIFKS